MYNTSVDVTDIQVKDNPSAFVSPFQFEITFDCYFPIKEDLCWSLIYVGSAESNKYDQVLEKIQLGPVNVGTSKFVFQADPPDYTKIPKSDVLGVTVLLLTCSYKEKEWIRVGYYVSNEYMEPIDMEHPPSTLELSKVSRKILADQPRVTRFPIPWDEVRKDEPLPVEEGVQELEVEEESSDGEESEEDDEESRSADLEDSEGLVAEEGPFNFVI
eukprot:TRINITY_DN2270_c0_g1_i3.p1 TRINITY_DN2270_c0_g1~~TRINITY_DN2270_c0_g1_i3.p1  ORF type:complete len:215 (-),score=48.77 TRINITY_DN2270_c0_g1_i3:98-742(-)